MFLQGNKIYLKRPNFEDFKNTQNWLNDQKLTQYMQHGIEYTELYDIENFAKNNKFYFAIYKNYGEHVGNINLFNIHSYFRSAEISLIIKDQVQGYGTEAIKLIVEHAFNRMNLNKLKMGTIDKNIGCIKAFEKNGFLECGKLREEYFINGMYEDVLLYELLYIDYKGDIK